MIEPRADGTIPGPVKYGQVYKLVNWMTGEVGYNLWTSDLPNGDPDIIARITAYETFSSWASDIMNHVEANILCMTLNNQQPSAFQETDHTRMVARVLKRVESNSLDDIDGHTALEDMQEMIKDLQGRNRYPAIPGWGKRS